MRLWFPTFVSSTISKPSNRRISLHALERGDIIHIQEADARLFKKSLTLNAGTRAPGERVGEFTFALERGG